MTVSADFTGKCRRRRLASAASLCAASYRRILGANDRIGLGMIGTAIVEPEAQAVLTQAASRLDDAGSADLRRRLRQA